MFRGCVAPQVQRLLVGVRVSKSVPPVSSAWQRYKGGPSFLAGVLGNSHALTALHLDPPMACDIPNSDLTRTGAATRSRRVPLKVSLVVPSRGIRITTSSRPRELCQENGRGRLFHHGTGKGNVDTSVPNNCNRHLQKNISHSLLRSTQDAVSMPGRSHTKQAGKKQARKGAKKPLKARQKQAPKEVPSTNHRETVTYSQKPRNFINNWITKILEKTKRVREELLEGKYADLGRLHTAEDEAKILHYKKFYVTQLKKKTDVLSSRSVNDNQVQYTPTATLNRKHCSKDSKSIGLNVKDPIFYNFSNTIGVTPTRSIAQQKSRIRQNQYCEDSTARTESNIAKLEEAEPPPEPRHSCDNIRAREDSLLNCVNRWRADRLVRPSDPMPYQVTKRNQKDSKKKGQPKVLHLVSRDQLNNLRKQKDSQEKLQLARSNLQSNDQLNNKMIFGEIKSVLMPRLSSQNCKSDVHFYKKATLQDNNYTENAAIFNQLKNDIHRRLWELSDDDESMKQNWVAMSRDNDEWKFRVAEMVSKCLFSIQNNMMNGSHVAYQGKDKSIGEIAEEFYKKYLQDLKSGGNAGGTWRIDKFEGPEQIKESKNQSRKTKEGLFKSGLSNLSSQQLSLIGGQIDDIVFQCQLIKREINKKSANENLNEDNTRNFSDDDQNQPKGDPYNNERIHENEGLSKEYAEEELVKKNVLECKSAEEPLKKRSDLHEFLELIQQKKCLELRLRKKFKEINQKLKSEEKNECEDAKKDEKEKKKYAEMDLWENSEEMELKEKCKELDQKEKCEEMERRKKCDEMEMNEKCEEIKQMEKCEEMEQREKCKEMEQRKKCEEMEQREKCKEIEQRKKCEEIEQRKKCEEIEQMEKCEEMEQRKKCEEMEQMEKCEEMEQREKCKEIEQSEKCNEMEQNKKCEEMKQKEKCKEMQDREKRKEIDLKDKCEELDLKKKCEEINLREKCAENDKKTNKNSETDNENEIGKREYNDLRKILLQLLAEICEEQVLKEKLAEKNKDIEGSTAEGTPKAVHLKKFSFPNLKNWYGTINRQNRGSDEQLKRLRSKMGLGQWEEDEPSNSVWTDSLRELRNLQDAGIDRTVKEDRLYPGSDGIFRSPTFAKGCAQDTLCGPISSVWPKLNGRDDREISFDHRKSLEYTGSTFTNSRNIGRFFQSPNLISWTIKDYLRLY